MMPEHLVAGWDIGGAHVKACLLQDGQVLDAAQWACPLWQGTERLAGVLQLARQRWPALGSAHHAVTMTGEMVDLFASREQGVQRIAAELTRSLVDASTAAPRGSLQFFAGDAGWCAPIDVGAHWNAIASANWLATARHCARRIGTRAGDGVLVDIGSTTTDLIAFRNGRVLTHCRTDAQRLASAELVYHGVVRTPLCALAQRIAWRGVPHNVMNEFFATTADVYRLTGELAPAHDQYPSADNAAKDLPATRRRLARMIGHDACEAPDEDWLDFARAWREVQVAELGGQLRRVMDAHGLSDRVTVVCAGCGDFLVPDVVDSAMGATRQAVVTVYGADVADLADGAGAAAVAVRAWVQVCAPSVAVATLLDQDRR